MRTAVGMLPARSPCSGPINVLEIVLAHILISIVAVHAFDTRIGEILAGIEELGSALASSNMRLFV